MLQDIKEDFLVGNRVWGDNKGKLQKILPYLTNAVAPDLAIYRSSSSAYSVTDLSHDEQSLSHEIMHCFYFHKYILNKKRNFTFLSFLGFMNRSGYFQLTGNSEKNVIMAISSQLEIARKR